MGYNGGDEENSLPKTVGNAKAGDKVKVLNQEHLRYIAMNMIVCSDAVKTKGRKIPECLKPQLNLKDICRRFIREHLLCLNPILSLPGRIRKLKIPTSLHRYLLYDDDKKMDDNIGAAAAAAAADDYDWTDDDDDSWTDDYSDSDSDDRKLYNDVEDYLNQLSAS